MRVQVAPGKWDDKGPVSLIDSLWPCHARHRCGERVNGTPLRSETRVLDERGRWRRLLH